MPRRPASQSTGASPDDALLHALLADELPSRHGQVRRARLRSTSQQRHQALRGFRLRNWVDRTLLVIERGLVVLAALALLYWLADGYGRDWWYYGQQQQAAQAAAPAALAPTPALSMPERAPDAAALLPFTRPGTSSSSEADAFMVPQAARTVPDLGDPRPVRMAMPSIGTEMGVYEIYLVDGEWEVAEYAAGYHFGSALPGMVGNSVISGHAGLRGAVFKDLGRLRPGDEVIVETTSWRYVYRVRQSFNVWPHQVEVMDPTPSPVLTLITCTNWDTQRLIVVADLVDARPLS
ncbi:MAG: sortase [Oscillochloridaceae bacterium umkhey_bin13]